MKSFARTHVLATLLGLMVTASGTAAAAATAPTSTAESSPPASEPSATDPVSYALAYVKLSDQQRAAVQQIFKPVIEKRQALSNANVALNAAAADVIRAGGVDASALKDKIDAVVQAGEDLDRAYNKAYDEVHALLNPEQRAAFARALDGYYKGGGGPVAPLIDVDAIAKIVGASDDQKRRMQAVMEKYPRTVYMPEHFEWRDFEKDDFSADKTQPVADQVAWARARLNNLIPALQEIIAILTPEQRVALADAMKGTQQAGGGGAGGS